MAEQEIKEQKTKCLHCKHYLRMDYINSVLSNESVYCLKLNQDIGNRKVVTACTKFKPTK